MNIIKVDDLKDNRIAMYTGLNEVQLLRYFEPAGGAFICESPVVIERALNAGCEPMSFLADTDGLKDVEVLIKGRPDVPVYTAPYEVLNKMIGYNLTRGVLCFMRRKPLPRLEELLGSARRIAVLEEVMNPTNVGAIFRSAAALNVDTIILTAGSSDPLYRRAARVSMGTVFQIPWTKLAEHAPWVSVLKDRGFKLVSMALRDNAVALDDARLNAEDKLAIIFGTESTGISEAVLDASDYIVKIPMSHDVDSLNVAAASAVAFWQLCR